MSIQDPGGEEFVIKRDLRRPLTIALVFLVGVGALVWVAMTSYTVTEDKVLIAPTIVDAQGDHGQWWRGDEGGQASLRFAEALREPMGKVGFTVIDPNAPEVAEAMAGATSREDLIDRARKLGAGVLMTGTLTPTLETTLGEGGQVELALEGEVELILTGHEETQSRVVPLRRFQGGPDRQDTIRLAAKATASHAFDELVAAIITMPEVLALFDEETRTSEQAQVAYPLKPAYNFSELRLQAIAARDEALERARERFKDQDAGPSPITQLSPFGREDTLVGVMPGGTGVVATVKDRRFFMDRDSLMLKDAWLPERVDFIDPQGGSHTIFEAWNIFGSPSLSADGRTLAVVTADHANQVTLRAVTLDPATGAPGQPRVLTSVIRGDLSFPTVSPDGQWVLYKRRECRRCNAHLELIGADGKNHRVIHEADDWRGAGDAHWLGTDSKRLAFVRWHTEGGRELIEVNLDADTRTTIHQNDETHQHINERFSADGQRMAWVRGGPEGRQLLIRDLGTPGAEPVELVQGVYTKRPVISPDGQWVAFEAEGEASPKDRYHGDAEVTIVPAAGGEARRLTVNDLKDRHVRWAPDRQEIYFETVYEDPQTHDPWIAVRSLKLPETTP